MWSLYKLQAKVWVSNMFNKIDFFMTIMFLVVMGSFVEMRIFENSTPDSYATLLSKANISVIASITLMMVASSSINTFGISFYEMRESVMLKRIGATNLNKGQAIISFMLWGMTSMVLLIGWMFIFVGICQIPGSNDIGWLGGILWIDPNDWANINWLGFFIAIIITMLSFYAISFFFISVAKDAATYQMIGTFYFFLIAFLGGSFTPNADRTWMNVISFLSPLGWGSDLMNYSMNGYEVFNFKDGLDYFNPTLGSSEHIKGIQLCGNIVMPVIYGVLAGAAAAKLFKWD